MNKGADMMSRIYHQQRGGAPMHQQMQPQGLGAMMGMAQQQMGVAPRPQAQMQSRSPYNAGGSGAMMAIMQQLMQRKGG